MGKKGKIVTQVAQPDRPRLRYRIAVKASLSGVGGLGFALWLLGPAGVSLLGLLLILAFLGLMSAAVFSSRDEPSRRLERLIKAILRGRR